MTLRIERLTRRHRPLIRGFDNQHTELVEYLRRYALAHDERDLLSRTRVALDDVDGEERVLGYHSLAASSVERSTLAAPSKLPRFPVPAILLARLAVDSRVQGQGLGKYLFEDAFLRVIEVAEIIGIRLFVADAKDEAAAEFYLRRGMFVLTEGPPRRMALDLSVLPSRG